MGAMAAGVEWLLVVDNSQVQLRDHVPETLRLVEDQAHLLKAPHPETRPDVCRVFAAGGLMRCRELLRGISLLEAAGLDIPAGILYRQHWETWLVSVYVLLRGEEALSEIGADYVKNTRLLTKELKLELEHVPDKEEGASRLNFHQIAQDLGPLLVEAGDAWGGDAGIMAYNVTYRVQSQYAVHVGLSTIRPHIRIEDQWWSVELNPPPPFDGHGQFAAIYTLHLAKYVFNRFGIATIAVEAAMDELHQYLKNTA